MNDKNACHGGSAPSRSVKTSGAFYEYRSVFYFPQILWYYSAEVKDMPMPTQLQSVVTTRYLIGVGEVFQIAGLKVGGHAVEFFRKFTDSL